jgi:hypothetical protein
MCRRIMSCMDAVRMVRTYVLMHMRWAEVDARSTRPDDSGSVCAVYIGFSSGRTRSIMLCMHAWPAAARFTFPPRNQINAGPRARRRSIVGSSHLHDHIPPGVHADPVRRCTGDRWDRRHHYRNRVLCRVSKTLGKGYFTLGKAFAECNTRQRTLGKDFAEC